MSDAERSRRFRPRFSLFAMRALLLLLAGAGPALGQELVVHVAPNPAAVYEKVDLSVFVPAANAEEVSASFPEGSHAIHVVSGPYVQPYVENGGSAGRVVRVSYVIEGTEPGRFVQQPLTITVGGVVRKTIPVVMSFGVPRGGRIVVPLQPVWSLPAGAGGTRRYVGQAIPVVLELRNEAMETKVDSFLVSGAPPGLEQVPQFAHGVRTVVDGSSLYQIPVASFLLTVDSPGTVTLPSATVTAGGRSGESIPRTISIAAAPPDITKSGAIGIFSFRSWTTTQTVSDGEELLLHLRVEGSGNLPRVVLPRPQAHGLLELGNNETHKMVAGAAGYTGFRQVDYRYLLQGRPPGGPSASGGSGESSSAVGDTAVIRVPGFAWLDPESGGVRSVAEHTYAFSPPASRGPGSEPSAGGRQGGAAAPASSATGTSTAGQSAAASRRATGASGTGAGLPFGIESASIVRRSEYRQYYSQGNTYLWLLPGPAIFCLFLLVRPKRKKGSGGMAATIVFLLLLSCRTGPVHDSVSAGVTAYEAGNFDQAAKDFTRALATYPHNAALSYDFGLVEFRRGRYGEAIHDLRTAIYYSPLSGKYRAALDWMVSQIGVAEQVSPAYPVHPDLFLFALIACINAASLLGILVLMKRSGRLAIALILSLVLSLISAGGLGYTALKRTAETGVVKSSGTEMTKIPMAVAGRWLELPAGMAVRIRDSAEEYYLIETAYGNTGWIRKNSLLIEGK